MPRHAMPCYPTLSHAIPRYAHFVYHVFHAHAYSRHTIPAHADSSSPIYIKLMHAIRYHFLLSHPIPSHPIPSYRPCPSRSCLSLHRGASPSAMPLPLNTLRSPLLLSLSPSRMLQPFLNSGLMLLEL